MLSLSVYVMAALGPTPPPLPTVTNPGSITELARQSCVRVLERGKARGTGFFIDAIHVATCFHVVADNWELRVENGSLKTLSWNIRADLAVKVPSGEVIDATFVSVPTKEDYSPVAFDFAVLRLVRAPSGPQRVPSLHTSREWPAIGSEVQFTGYPLAAPAMLTHHGRISGYTSDLGMICIQAPVNRGSSGSALLAGDGHVLGIISDREGALVRDLSATRDYIKAMGDRMGGISFEVDTPAGRKVVNQNSVLIDTIDTLDAYISTGIGYARSSTFLRLWLERHPLEEQR